MFHGLPACSCCPHDSMAEGVNLPFDFLGLEAVVFCDQDLQVTPPADVSARWGYRIRTAVPP